MKLTNKISIIVLILLLLCGCYNSKELDDLAYVIGIGIDKGKNKKYEFTFQIAVPVNISGEGSKPGSDTSSLLTIEANTIDTAISLANTRTSKEITLSHNKVIVFSKEVAEDGLEQHASSFIASKEIRPRNSIIVCEDSARKFLESAVPVLENDPARFYELLLSSANYTGYTVRSELVNFCLDAKSKYVNPIAVLGNIASNGLSAGSESSPPKEEINETSGDESITVKEDLTPNLYGIAVFAGSKMIGELTGEETIAHLILTHSLKTVNLDIEDIVLGEETTAIAISQSKPPVIKVTVKNNIPEINIKLNIDAKLNSNLSVVDYQDESNRSKLSLAIKNKLGKIIDSYLTKITHEYKSDIVGFGKLLRTNYLTQEELDKIDWPEIFPSSKFNTNLNIILDTTQLVSNSREFSE